MPDGNVLYTEWRHLGDVNDGHLRMMNPDMTRMREAFGGEDGGKGGTNSYLKARFVETYTDAPTGADRGPPGGRGHVARSHPAGWQAVPDRPRRQRGGARFIDLTPLVPGDRVRSQPGIGRYYDAEIVGDPTKRTFLTSWADGPVESEALAMANTNANFGLYVFDATSGTRFPLYDDPTYWDVLARPVKARPEPA